MVERKVYEYELADGKLYIKILHAERKLYGGDYYGAGATEEIKGRVHLSTSPEFEADTDRGFVKVRGRKYAIENMLTRLPQSRVRVGRHGRAVEWWRESTYGGGFRSELGRQVKYEAKAHDYLEGIQSLALSQFEEEFPHWVKESTLLLFEGERERAARESTELRGKAAEADAKAAKWQKRIDELGAVA